MATTVLTRDALRAGASTAPDDAPVVMLNLLRFNEQTLYQQDGFDPCPGAQAYFDRYVPAFNAVVSEFGGAKPLYIGSALSRLVGPPDDEWDNVALIEYPSYSAMVAILESPRYLREAEPHRVASLADWRFIATRELTL